MKLLAALFEFQVYNAKYTVSVDMDKRTYTIDKEKTIGSIAEGSIPLKMVITADYVKSLLEKALK